MYCEGEDQDCQIDVQKCQSTLEWPGKNWGLSLLIDLCKIVKQQIKNF